MVFTFQKEKRISLHSPIDIVRQSYVARVISNFFSSLKNPIPTKSTGEQFNTLVEYFLEKHGCHSSIKGYREFPSSISVGANNIMAHGVPNSEPMEDDDVVTIDIVAHITAANNKKYHADMAHSFVVGKPSLESQKLLSAAWNISRAGVMSVKPGNTLLDVAYAVQEETYREKAFVYKEFAGHGIGNDIHEGPKVYYNSHAPRTKIVAGMVLCIEPIVSLFPQRVVKNKDGSYRGVKGHKCAVFEHMVAVFSAHSVVLSYGGLYPENLVRWKL